MSPETTTAGVPSPDVLPSGVHRRLRPADVVLAIALLTEMLVGVGVRAVWESRAEIGWLGIPAPAVAPNGPGGGAAPATASVVAPQQGASEQPAPAPALRTVPRNPFQVLAR